MRFFIFIVEAPRILFKDTASRTDYPIQMRFFIFIVEAPRILFKDTTSRTDYPIQMRFFIFIVEAQCIVIILIIYCQKRIKYMLMLLSIVR